MPYINHPIHVARLLAEIGGVVDEDVLIAAVLHDTIEDTATTRAELAAAYGPVELGYVFDVTDDKSLPSERRKLLQIEHAPQKSRARRLVKLADKISNVGDLGHSPPVGWSLERVGRYLDWAEKVVGGLPKVNAAARIAVRPSAGRRAQEKSIASDCRRERAKV